MIDAHRDWFNSFSRRRPESLHDVSYVKRESLGNLHECDLSRKIQKVSLENRASGRVFLTTILAGVRWLGVNVYDEILAVVALVVLVKLANSEKRGTTEKNRGRETSRMRREATGLDLCWQASTGASLPDFAIEIVSEREMTARFDDQ